MLHFLIDLILITFLILGSITRFLSSLRAVDDLNLSLTQQLQIIMKDVPSCPKTKDEDQDGEKCQIEPEGDQEVSNTHTEDDGLVDEDQMQ